jgi:predicted RNA-binding protein YlxR (DUF448 family)
VGPADELDRVVALPDGGLGLGRTLQGRGAWLCRGSLACFDAAVRRQAFPRALRTTVGSEALASLRATLVNRARMSTEATQPHRSSKGTAAQKAPQLKRHRSSKGSSSNGIAAQTASQLKGIEWTTPPSADDAHVEQTEFEEHRKD